MSSFPYTCLFELCHNAYSTVDTYASSHKLVVIESLSHITVSIVFLWIMVDLHDFLVLFIFPSRI